MLFRGFLVFFEIFFFISGLIISAASDELSDHKDHKMNAHPRMLSSPSQLSAREGDTVVFPCRAEDLGKSVLIWRRDKTKVLFVGSLRVEEDKRFSLVGQTSSSSSALQIQSVSAEYAGNYICSVSEHSTIELIHVLNVLVPPKITLDPSDGLVVANKGDPISVKCLAEGFPNPTVTWKALKGSLQGGVREKQGSILSIASADSHHTGTYECKAENSAGDPDTAIIRIKVLYAPELTVTPTWVHAGVRSSVEFRCTAYAEPPATLFWTRYPGSLLMENNYVSFQQTVRSHSQDTLILKLRRITSEYFGNYACFANNSLGSAFRNVEVSGLAEPVKFRSNRSTDEENNFMLTWTVKSYSPIIEYLLRIRQQKSKDSSSRPPSWTEIMIPVSVQQSVLHSDSYNITGLEAAIAYEVVMQARNSFGWNHPSETFTFYTLGGEPQADAIEDLTSEQAAEQMIVYGTPFQNKDMEQEPAMIACATKHFTFFNFVTIILLFCISMKK